MDYKPSVRHAMADASSLSDEMICSECFKMICNYDEARSNARRFKKQLRQKLAITETYFEQSQNKMDTTQTAKDGGEDDRQHGKSDVEIMEDDACDIIDLCDDD